MINYHKTIRYTGTLRGRLEDIKNDLRKRHGSDICPDWNNLGKLGDSHNCRVCETLFPKAAESDLCPCDTYSREYLIRRLNEIITYYETIKGGSPS